MTSGVGVLIGSLFGIGTETVAAGVRTEIRARGTHVHLKTAAVVMVVGEIARFDVATRRIGNDPADTPVGVVTVAAAGPAASVEFDLG